MHVIRAEELVKLTRATGEAGSSGAFEPGHERPSRFPPIADYGFLGPRSTMALVASSGEVEWLCLPRPDSPSVFATMLDRAAGRVRGPADQRVPAARRYVPGTNVLETSWGDQGTDGWWCVTVSAIGRWSEAEHRDPNHPRPPSDHRAERVLLRTVECVNGSVEVEVTCHPVFDYGRTPGRWNTRARTTGTWWPKAVTTTPSCGSPRISGWASRRAAPSPSATLSRRVRLRGALLDGDHLPAP